MTASDLGELPPEVAQIGPSGRTAVVQMVIRTGVLRSITFVGAILLARILAPADYGVFAVVIFLVGMLAPIGDLGLGSTLIRKRDRPTEIEIATAFTTQQLVWLSLVALVWILASLASVVAPDVSTDFEWMIRVAAVALLLAQLQSIPNAMMSRVLRFGPLAMIEVVAQVVYLSVALLCAINGAGAWSFIIGLLAQYAVAAVLTFVAWGRLPGIGIDRAALRGMWRFGVAFQLTNLTNLLREAVIPLFGGLAGGVNAIGYLQFGQRLGRLVGGFDEIAARVSFPTFSRLQDDLPRTNRVLGYVVETTALGLALVMGWAIAAAPSLIPLLFGEQWTPAVPVFQLTTLAGLLAPPAVFLRGIGFAAGRAGSLLRWSAFAAALTFLVFPFLVAWLGLVGGGIGFVVFAAVSLFGCWFATRGVADFPWLALARIYVIGAVAAVASAVALTLQPGILGLVLSGLVFAAVYGLLVLAFERQQVHRAWHLLRTGKAAEAT